MSSSSQNRSKLLLEKVHEIYPQSMEKFSRTLEENLREIFDLYKDLEVWDSNTDFVNLVLRYRDSVNAFHNLTQIITMIKFEIDRVEKHGSTQQKLLGMLSFVYYIKFSLYQNESDKTLAIKTAIGISPTIDDIKEPHALFVLGTLINNSECMQLAIKMEFPYALCDWIYFKKNSSTLYQDEYYALARSAELGLAVAFIELAFAHTEPTDERRYVYLLEAAKKTSSGLGALGYNIFFGDYFNKDEVLGKRLVQTSINVGDSPSLFYMAVILIEQSTRKEISFSDHRAMIEEAMRLLRATGKNVAQEEIVKVLNEIYLQNATNPFIIFHAALYDIKDKTFKKSFIKLAEEDSNKLYELASAYPDDIENIKKLLKGSPALKPFEIKFNQVARAHKIRTDNHFLFAHFPSKENHDQTFDHELQAITKIKAPDINNKNSL